MYGDCSASFLDMLGALSKDVMIPMLSRAANEQPWPDMLSRRVQEHMHKFAASGASVLHKIMPVQDSLLSNQPSLMIGKLASIGCCCLQLQ